MKGRKPKKVTPTPNKEFQIISRYYAKNEEKDTLVECLNELPNEERNIIILLLKVKTIKAMAENLNCSQQLVRKKVKAIKEKIKNNYNKKLNKENE